jgi:O-antigen/teichoic acid export membrane protein
VKTAATVATDEPAPRWNLVRSTAILGAALMAANLANYLLAIIGSHQLRPSDYSLLGAMLAVLLVAGIPSLALQAVVARRTATDGLAFHDAIRDGALTGAASVVIGLIAWPGLAVFLHVDHHGLAVLFAITGLLPLNLLAAVQGHLQGNERFARLSAVVIVIGIGRLIGGVVPLALGGGATSVMAGIAIATGASCVVGLRVAAAPTRRPIGTVAAPTARPELLTATLSIGALLLLSSLDLLFARHLLTATVSGRYAAGAVVAKAAFWLPQAIPLTALPRLSRGVGRERALREAAILTAAIAIACIAVTAVGGVFLVRLTFGASYASIGHVAWLFALQGSALAGVQLLIIDDIAARRRRVVPVVLIAAAIEAAVVLSVRPRHPDTLIAIATTAAAVLCAITTYRRTRLATDPDLSAAP